MAVTPAALALLTAGLLTACGTEAKPSEPAAQPKATATTTAGTPTPAASSAPAAVEAGGSLGGPGTVCDLPVSFTLAADWEPKAIKKADDPDLDELRHQGPATAVCEVDAKPAGNIGFLRVWTAPKDMRVRPALEGFVKAEHKTSDIAYRDVKAGALAAVELTYTVRDFDGETVPKRAFAVATPQGPVIVHLGGFDAQEHRELLPAYELARTSLKLR
ncbi:lipoprotein [Streptomyces sp. NPDC048717]|uniref:lipoprotein n=1 Tax=Streptomyces sp. NPDC048717 TaxID=3154928 RepID=UPI0034170FE5